MKANVYLINRKSIFVLLLSLKSLTNNEKYLCVLRVEYRLK